MKLCFPVINDEGLESKIYGHFASAPRFVVIDTLDRQSSAIDNCDRENPFAGCNPFSALKGKQLDAIIVGGIGDESVRVMNLCGYKVFQAQSPAVAENIALFEQNALTQVVAQDSHLEGRCGGDTSVHKCNHHHH
jgi:predicted Fe-Mo cluster-binding NifX family protein